MPMHISHCVEWSSTAAILTRNPIIFCLSIPLVEKCIDEEAIEAMKRAANLANIMVTKSM